MKGRFRPCQRQFQGVSASRRRPSLIPEAAPAPAVRGGHSVENHRNVFDASEDGTPFQLNPSSPINNRVVELPLLSAMAVAGAVGSRIHDIPAANDGFIAAAGCHLPRPICIIRSGVFRILHRLARSRPKTARYAQATRAGPCFDYEAYALQAKTRRHDPIVGKGNENRRAS
jgi:hypothetical protein